MINLPIYKFSHNDSYDVIGYFQNLNLHSTWCSNQSFVNNMEWTTEHRAFLVEFYFRLGGSAVGALRKLKAHLKINRNVSLPIQAEKQCNTGLRSSESQDPPELNAEFHHRRSVLPKASRKWKFRSNDSLCVRPQNTHWPWGFWTGRCEEFYIATWIFTRTVGCCPGA